MLNRIRGVRNERRRNVRHDFASTSNSQQNSGLSNNKTAGPSNVNTNIQSTSSHSNSTFFIFKLVRQINSTGLF